MPGICGFINQPPLPEKAPCLNEMTGVPVWSMEQSVLQCAMTAIAEGVGYDMLEQDELALYLIGDIYSYDGQDVISPLVLLAQAWQQGRLAETLARVNGYFVLVLWDKRQQKLLLVTDRLGTKPLYLWTEANKLQGFASEIKALALHPQARIELDQAAIEAAMQFGHYLHQFTGFKGIDRLAPATVVTVDLNSNEYSSECYWQWRNIAKQTISFDDAVDTLYQKFDKAIERCVNAITQDTLAITLSGGLDSRALVAGAARHFKGKIKTFTFGQPDCDDAIIAKQVSDVAGAEHELHHMHDANWFDGRDKGVWRADGQFNLVHMHALSSCPKIKAHSYYLLNGYSGDALLGGSFLLPGINDMQATEELVDIRHPGKAHLWMPVNDYLQFPGTDPIFIYHRCTRFTAGGTDLLSADLHNLKPFIDNDLLEFAYSLPDNYRRNSRVYNAMLLKYYPEYFATIPWQKTGRPIEVPAEVVAQSTLEQPGLLKRLRKSLIGVVKGSAIEPMARKLYALVSRQDNYVDYAAWMRTPEFKRYLTEMLTGEDAKLVEHLDRSLVTKTLDNFFNVSTVRPEALGTLLSLELYLRQLQEHKAG